MRFNDVTQSLIKSHYCYLPKALKAQLIRKKYLTIMTSKNKQKLNFHVLINFCARACSIKVVKQLLTTLLTFSMIFRLSGKYAIKHVLAATKREKFHSTKKLQNTNDEAFLSDNSLLLCCSYFGSQWLSKKKAKYYYENL